jgi:AmmeMemoRadiSam system protein A
MKTEHQTLLLQIARDAIFQALETGRSGTRPFFRTLEEKFPGIGKIAELQEERATFVTLTIGGALRGCIGMLEACRPLAEDVAENARAAAFDDPRFAPLSREEFARLEIHISVLSPPGEMAFRSEADLLEQIRPGVDGLILQEGGRRGTFLPSVWEELPDRTMFLMHLKMKAGLPGSYWSDTLRVFRYTAEYFPA